MPTNHVISIRDQRISVCDARVVVGSKNFDTFTVDADHEWDGLSLIVAFGTGESQVLVSYGGAPSEIPRQCVAEPGWVPVAVVGYGDDGEVKATTEAAPHAINSVLDGQVPDNPYPDSPDLLGQLVGAYERADKSADKADEAAASANEAAEKADGAADAATKAADRADASAKAANDAADLANEAAEAAGERVLYAYPDPEASDRIVLQYPSFLESEDGGSVYLALEAANG